MKEKRIFRVKAICSKCKNEIISDIELPSIFKRHADIFCLKCEKYTNHFLKETSVLEGE